MSTTTLHDRIAESFQRQRLLSTPGARLARVAEGEVEIELAWSEAIQQQHGFVHAGAIATIADSACGYACLTWMPEGSAVLSVEFKINLLAPAVGERFVARGRVVRVGRTIGVATAEVVAHSGTKPQVCVAVMQATMMRVEARNGVGG
ncbi:MAG: PaaI family thioesterase [Planctomycetes bacterium]|nr:PaaI family thioesterase [Planctomycetota bacterium]